MSNSNVSTKKQINKSDILSDKLSVNVINESVKYDRFTIDEIRTILANLPIVSEIKFVSFKKEICKFKFDTKSLGFLPVIKIPTIFHARLFDVRIISTLTKTVKVSELWTKVNSVYKPVNVTTIKPDSDFIDYSQVYNNLSKFKFGSFKLQGITYFKPAKFENIVAIPNKWLDVQKQNDIITFNRIVF